MPNRLIDETSPYLLQHAHNPVDWRPWGSEALERAREQDMPILLSVGYAACHWCHVMERESFEDDATAALMNEAFVCIKVDREERPDIDSIYMSAVQAMTGHGGWPMTVFLTPDGRPFYGGTYWPNEPRHGMPAFTQVLEAVRDAWANRRDEIEQQGSALVDHIAQATALRPGEAGPDALLLGDAARVLIEHLDDEWGGFGGAPKFPQPMNIELLLRAHLRGVDGALHAATLTLDRMARGGMFDQLGGGFHRYSVDRVWLVPHFEKMLYDNALLLRTYARAYQITGSTLYRETALATGGWLIREMQHPDGGFWSALDADSDGVEGRFYVWPYEELIAVTGEDMPVAVSAFAAAGNGNWEGVNVLWRPEPDEVVAERHGLSVAELRATLERVRARMLDARAARTRPATDDKVLASWNGLAIAGLAEAGRALGHPPFIEAAERAASFVLAALRAPSGRLLRAWREGRTSGPGYLDDHAMLADGLLTLYETTFETRWWREAMGLAQAMIELFTDPEGGFFDTGADAPATIVRPKDLFDNAVPSGNASASDVLLRLSALAGDPGLSRAGSSFLTLLAPVLRRSPSGFGHAICAADRLASPGPEIAIVGPAGSARDALVSAVHERFIPGSVLAAGGSGDGEPALLADRPAVGGIPTAYVCQNWTCKIPVTSENDLVVQLGQAGLTGLEGET